MTYRTQVGASVADLSNIAEKKLSQLYEAVRDQKAAQDDFEEARVILETLPLMTSEFGLAKCRIGNAERYFALGEKGASAFELLLALRSLERQPSKRP